MSLRRGTTHDVLACWFGVDRSTITRAIGEVRPLLAQRGCPVAPDDRLRTLAEVVEYLGVDGRTGIIDGTEIRVRRPAAGRKDRDKFVSGKTKQNAVKALVITDVEGRVLFCSPVRPGSCADITQARQLGLAQLLAEGPFLEVLADAGYQGTGAQTGGRVVTPPYRKFKKNAPAWYEERHEQQRKTHSSRRIRVEHGIVQAVAGLLSHQQTASLGHSLQGSTATGLCSTGPTHSSVGRSGGWAEPGRVRMRVNRWNRNLDTSGMGRPRRERARSGTVEWKKTPP